ncbi:ribonucleoside-diphosphate reductase [Nocardioides sp. dk4132]|uniref:ribonucleotide reductase N-terminal alpha domain-containing protein n=1 Tax=unclassified Nocardioides TaxID=2615069 RepID=UPI001298110F|nr:MULTISPECIES: ribonucleotide reductase N-terminal alpha domain-containing protein [unclassified Nocardioides]MQW77306.1 ribonucleoside-diphosphate reductase [Nocardioides sp. dk4132]QGA08060.1 ribonucleoside-diphosphate reductase [Nocardioides sp. dk884]
MTNKNWETLSAERKALQAAETVPAFMTTAGYAMVKAKYTVAGQSVRERYETIARTAGVLADEMYPREDGRPWTELFFEAIWNGWLSPSTPVLANLGTTRGLPVSCEGSYIEDSVWGFYETLKEAAILSQNGFGTSAYLGDIRPRGASFGDNGKANGVVPVFCNFAEMTNQISQGATRRGSWAGYLPVDHPDFHELADLIYREPANKNVGWIFTQAFIDRMLAGDKDALERYQRVLKIRVVLGKGYIWKVDTVNAHQTESYRAHGLENKASNLCSEITLFSDEEHSYTCVLSSLNLATYDEWRDRDTAYVATVFLDAVAEAFLRRARQIRGLERAVRYTEKARSLGLGVMGYHDYLQRHSVPFESEKAAALNIEIFEHIHARADAASRWMGEKAGVPAWCVGRRNSHLMAVAPTMSTAVIVGGTSQGIEPYVANVWNQTTSAGEMPRANGNLVRLMKDRGVYDQASITDIIDHGGSVQHVGWLDEHEKDVFKTGYEIDQEILLDRAADRQAHIDQAQSLNLFFPADASPHYISKVHKKALLDPGIKSLYYLRSRAGIQASKQK